MTTKTPWSDPEITPNLTVLGFSSLPYKVRGERKYSRAVTFDLSPEEEALARTRSAMGHFNVSSPYSPTGKYIVIDSYRGYMWVQINRIYGGQEPLTYMEWERETLRKQTELPKWSYFKRVRSSLPTFLPYPEGQEPQEDFEALFTVEGKTWGLVDHPASWWGNLGTLFAKSGKPVSFDPPHFKVKPGF
jgi:hypothetical protein